MSKCGFVGQQHQLQLRVSLMQSGYNYVTTKIIGSQKMCFYSITTASRLQFCSRFVCRLSGLVTSTLNRINHVNPGCRKGPTLANRGPGRRFESPLDHVYIPTTLPGILAAKRRVEWLTTKRMCNAGSETHRSDGSRSDAKVTFVLHLLIWVIM